jgi:hypothetical protein
MIPIAAPHRGTNCVGIETRKRGRVSAFFRNGTHANSKRQRRCFICKPPKVTMLS